MKIKRLSSYILQSFGYLAAKIGCLKLFDCLAWMRNQAYTGFYRNSFAHWGNNSVLNYHAINLKGLSNISVGDHTVLGSAIQLTTWAKYQEQDFHPHISIGNHCIIRDGAHITAINSITIGDNLLTGTNVLITDNAHGEFTIEQLKLPPIVRPLHSKGPVVIGNNVWLGNNVCVLPGVTIGDGAVIGANSVVIHDIPPYSMAAGMPASIIKQL